MRGSTGGAFVLGVVALAVASAVTGCSGGSCDERDGCPVVDQSAAPGDLQFEFAPGELVTFASGGKVGLEVLSGGEIVVAPIDCADFEHCTITVKRLMFRFEPITVGYGGGGGTVTAEGTTVSFAAPLTLTGSALTSFGFSLPPGSIVHTCSTLDGRPWHSSAAIPGTQNVLSVLLPSLMEGSPVFQGTLPVPLRADDSTCSRFTFEASFLATSQNAEAAGDGGSTGEASVAASDATVLDNSGDDAADAPD
jgi:hypothetical protein